MKTIVINSKKHGRKEVYVDDEMYEYVKHWKWCVRWSPSSKTFYCERRCQIDGKYYGIKMHRFILGLTDPKIEADHINHNGLDNIGSNIRITTRGENNRNKRAHSTSNSPYKGVCKRGTKAGTYRTQIQVNGVKVYRKEWNTEMEAALDYDRNVVRFHGEHAYLNFPAKIK